MQHGFGVGERGVQAGQVGAGDRVDEHGASALSPQLHQECAMPVPEARRSLRIDSDRTSAAAQRSGGRIKGGGAGHQWREPVTRLQ